MATFNIPNYRPTEAFIAKVALDNALFDLQHHYGRLLCVDCTTCTHANFCADLKNAISQCDEVITRYTKKEVVTHFTKPN